MAELMKSEGDDLYLFLIANALMVKISDEDVIISQLNRYINRIVEKERAACADVAESIDGWPSDAAKAIRGR